MPSITFYFRFLQQFRSASDKEKVMAHVALVYETFEIFDKLRENHKHIDELMIAAMVPDSVFVRECLVGAYECDFHSFSLKTDNDLRLVARGPGIKAVDYFHCALNRRIRQNMNDQHSRSSRWLTAINSGIVEDNDRMQPDPTNDDRREAQSNSLNNKHFDVKAGDFSLGEQVFEAMLKPRD